MRVYIANFGRGNWAWPDCLANSTIAVMDDSRVNPFWREGNREGYIMAAQKYLRLYSGSTVTRPVASRWFNLNTVLAETGGDLWIHREKEQLWWTESLAVPTHEQLRDDPNPRHGPAQIYFYQKACSGWSDKDKRGRALSWGGLHARAREFLFTEGTFQQLSPDNADYALGRAEGTYKIGYAARRPVTGTVDAAGAFRSDDGTIGGSFSGNRFAGDFPNTQSAPYCGAVWRIRMSRENYR